MLCWLFTGGWGIVVPSREFSGIAVTLVLPGGNTFGVMLSVPVGESVLVPFSSCRNGWGGLVLSCEDAGLAPGGSVLHPLA